MPNYSARYSTWDNDTLILKEIFYRRSIASNITSLTLAAGATLGSGGAFAILTVPIGGLKLYKINSHKSKLKAVRAELAKRHLSPADKRKRDVLVPVAVACTVSALTLGLADVIDIMPSNVQQELNGHVESAIGVEPGSGGLDDVENEYQQFIIEEAAAPITNAAMYPTLPHTARGVGLSSLILLSVCIFVFLVSRFVLAYCPLPVSARLSALLSGVAT